PASPVPSPRPATAPAYTASALPSLLRTSRNLNAKRLRLLRKLIHHSVPIGQHLGVPLDDRSMDRVSELRVLLHEVQGNPHLQVPPLKLHHRPPPAISVTAGNRNTCPTRSRPGSTPGLASRIAATICPVFASGQHVSAMRQSVSPGMTTHSAGHDHDTGSDTGALM